jgi:isopenicillin N synthase-like dioxygenase
MGHEKPFIKPVFQIAGSLFAWSPTDLHLLSIDFNANRTTKYNIKLFTFTESDDTGFPVRSDVIATMGCTAPPLALKWQKSDLEAQPHGLFGYCCSNGELSLVNPNSAISGVEAGPADLISIRLGEEPLLDFEFTNDESVIYALNKQALMKWKRGSEQWSSFALPDVYSYYISRERNYSISYSHNGTLIAAGKTISLFGNDESISNVLSFESKFISQMKWNPFKENCFAVCYTDSPVIEFFDTRKLSGAYESLNGHTKGVNSFNWGPKENQLISADKNNVAIRWDNGKILSQQFMPNCYDIKYSPTDPSYYAGYSASRVWVYKMNREDEDPTAITYLDSDLLVIDSEPEDALIPSLFTRVDLQKLRSEETKEREIRKLCDEVHRRSYAVITLPQELFQKFIAAREIFKEFCALEESVKNSIHIYPGRDVGYNNIPNVKEFFQMRRVAEEEKFPWPPGLPNFKEIVTDIWNFQEELAREIMSYMATGIGMQAEKFLELMDPLVLPPNEFSHSIMGLYHYFQHNDLTETCYTHKDMGLISFIPRSEVAGLQVVDYDANLWLDIEQVAQPTDVVMIVCETLDRITGGYYPANNHRVVGTTDRHSIVFKLRAMNNAVIDTANLGSPYIDAILSNEFKTPTTVGEFVDNQLKVSESINFPGASFDNYKNCILNPNMNYTGLRSENSVQSQSEMYM